MSDESARAAALDVRRSFIVQAPAGSGKTELLIQRYLALLAVVQAPEQVVAITFTRKAAAEMRSRVLQTLRALETPTPIDASHRRRTLELAAAVAERDRKLGWSLALQPQRLRIDTVDALNGWLAQRLPVLAGGIAGARLAEQPEHHYRTAARRMLGEIGAPGPLGESLRALARRLGNDLARLETLMVSALSRRDQWIRYVAGSDAVELRGQLQSAIERLIEETLASTAHRLRAHDVLDDLAFVADRVGRNRMDLQTESSTAAPPLARHLAEWKDMAKLLINEQGEWRRRLAAVGLRKGEPEHGVLESVIGALGEDEALRESLHAIRRLPDPRLDPSQWEGLDALRIALTHVVAELRVVFAEHDTADFVEIALAAQQALGRVDAPSDLLLALDHKIQHLLVDEFQDTSHTQLRLVELLTAGWQTGDGRTLFLVGDPMQSIYRFRDADMSLFLKVKERGIGEVRCQALQLENNFRSAPAILDFVNRTFRALFPAEDDLATGAAAFHPCHAIQEESGDDIVVFHALRSFGEREEIDRVVDILTKETQRFPEQSVAILVQSRSHLLGLHARLRSKSWPIHAVEIEPLDQQQLGQDLIGLTRALLHPADRVAWLAVLRAPWCGLTWSDLHTLCADEPDRDLWGLMHDETRLAQLSDDGHMRLRRVRAVLDEALRSRPHRSLPGWIERTWIALSGPACLEEAGQRNLVEQFLRILESLEQNGDLDDPMALEQACANTYGSIERAHRKGIEIMTIHRAKGLEFDCVVLLGLGRAPHGDDPRALYWMERVAADGREDFLLAPLAPTGEHDALTEYMKHVDRARDRAERARLLYVATTRARRRLHLIAQLDPNAEVPPAGSLLAQLWPQVRDRFQPSSTRPPSVPAQNERLAPKLRRLTEPVASWPWDSGLGQPTPAGTRPAFEWAGRSAVQVGVIVHRSLHRIASSGLEAWSTQRVRGEYARLRRELEILGVEASELDAAARRVVEALCGVLEDPRGRWLLAPRPLAQSEVELTWMTGAGLERIRLDRTFVDEHGTRWIVDFKTGTHEGGALEPFLEEEVVRYRPQLERYAHAMRQMDPRPLKVGLYFPLLREFRAWSPGAFPSDPEQELRDSR